MPIKRIWVPGYYYYDKYGRRIYVRGHYKYVNVPARGRPKKVRRIKWW